MATWFRQRVHWLSSLNIFIHFTCRILHRLQHVRPCRCLKVFLKRLYVINCLFNVQKSCAYSEELAKLTILGWTICLSKRGNKMLKCLKLIIHDCWSCGRIYILYNMCTNKSCIQTNSVGNPAWSQKRIYHLCQHEFTCAEFTGHLTHRASMYMHLLYT